MLSPLLHLELALEFLDAFLLYVPLRRRQERDDNVLNLLAVTDFLHLILFQLVWEIDKANFFVHGMIEWVVILLFLLLELGDRSILSLPVV